MCQWNYEKNKRIDPSRITEGSKRPVWWKCSEGHEWQARIYYRTKGTGCPHCARMKNRHAVYPGYNDLETLLPRLAEDWDYQLNGELRPSQILPSSNRTVWWKCKQGHNWRASPNQRSGGKGCPYCDGKTPPKKRLV